MIFMEGAPQPGAMDLHEQDDHHYLKFSAPMPTVPFLDVHDYDLPYGGKNFLHESFAKSHTATSPFQFKPSANVRKEGASLLAALTGVRSDVACYKSWVPGCGRIRCKFQQEFSEDNLTSAGGIYESKKKKTSRPSSQRTCRSTSFSLVDEAVDTGDLEGLVFTADTESESAAAQASSSSSSDEDGFDTRRDKAGANERSPEDYFHLIRESMGRIGLRTQMLQDLSLGESAAKDSPQAAPIRSTAAAAQAPAAAQDADAHYMSQTSVTVKHARKLAGLMHVDEQAIDLRDLLAWFQHLGTISDEGNEEYDSRPSLKPESTEQMKMRLQAVGGSDWRLPTSPPIALQLANEDLRNRLANLFQEKNYLNNKLKSMKRDDGLDEELLDQPEEFVSALRLLEEDYELLGSSVSQNLDAAERLEERYQLLEQQLNATGNSAGKHLQSVNKIKSLLGAEGLEDLKKIPESVKPDLGQKEPVKEAEDKHEEPKKKKGKKSKSPEAVSSEGDEELLVQPPIRIQSKVYPNVKRSQSPSPKLAKESEEDSMSSDRRSPSPSSLDTRSPSPSSGKQSPESRSLKLSSDSERGGAVGSASKNLIQIVQDEKSKSTSDRTDTHTHTRLKTEDAETRPRKLSRRDRAVQTDPVTVFSLIDEVEHPRDESPQQDYELSDARKLQEDMAKAREVHEAKESALTSPSTTSKTKIASRTDTVKEAPGTSTTNTAKEARGASPTSPDKEAPFAQDTSMDAHTSTKVKMLHNELEKSKKQLNFYRARNWGEKHEAHAVPTPINPSRRGTEEPLSGGDKDIGLVFVYNPTSGFHTMLTSGHIAEGSKSKGSLVRGSSVHQDKPMSAPAAVSRPSMPVTVSTNNRVVSAQQVMKLIAKRKEQQQQQQSKSR